MSFKRKLEGSAYIKSEPDLGGRVSNGEVGREGRDSGNESDNGIFEIQYARDSRNMLDTGNDFRRIGLKEDHGARPLWVCPNGQIYLDTENRYYQLATDFLVAIAEPVSRPELLHHYKLTPYSLYAAVSVNLDSDTIVRTLDKLGKFPVPRQVVKFIQKCTSSYGKAKLVLKQNRLLIESPYPEVLKKLLQNPVIRGARVLPKIKGQEKINMWGDDNDPDDDDAERFGFGTSEGVFEAKESEATDWTQLEKLEQKLVNRLEHAEDDSDDEMVGGGMLPRSTSTLRSVKEENKHFDDNVKAEMSAIVKTEDGIRMKAENGLLVNYEEGDFAQNAVRVETLVNFEINPEKIENVKSEAISIDFPLMEEYDFRKDDHNPDLPITLTGKLRPYQEKALSKMFGNGRARSGLIVLPCGAGKTLTGITACCTIKKSCIVFCNNAVAVDQWVASFKFFTTIDDKYIRKFTANHKEPLPDSGPVLLVTSYSFISYTGSRSIEATQVINQVKSREWGLLLMDEVHVVPAKMFRKALTHCKGHAKLGLSATLVREDGLIEDLYFLIGPKLYEANWMNLTNQGYLARVLCAELWCPMSPLFMKEYLRTNDAKRKQLLYVMNPIKYAMCKALMEYHEARNDKILIFSDDITALLRYKNKLRRYCLYGNTSEYERADLLARFRGGSNIPKEKVITTLFISSVGDVAIDLPEANIIIQISSHFGSRRQEAQRLGRILRPKSSAKFNVGYNAFFYTLVSMDTKEMSFSNRRQQYLVDQGYTYKVIPNLGEIIKGAGGAEYKEPTREDEEELLLYMDDETLRKFGSYDHQPKAKKAKVVQPKYKGKSNLIRKWKRR
mmetsp:Transcript_14221/g.16651  ORF Transcript_14221/g.16651 Transcript_14221/m.16651 type:complete len:840 (+) Transcript_14221:290-2809(+)